MTGLREAIGILTTFGRHKGALRSRACVWFPVVGAVLGALVGGMWWLTVQVWAGIVPGVLVVCADSAFTGMLHVDGLADSADGLLPHATRERRLEIMRTPDVGAFGTTVVAVTLLAWVGAVAAQSVSIGLVIALWTASRGLVAAVPAFVPYARSGGIASGLMERTRRSPILALPFAGVIAALSNGAKGVLALVAGIVAGVGVVVLAYRRLGGFTGDVLGATIVVVEVVGLIVTAGRW